jgi:hypothetical protein
MGALACAEGACRIAAGEARHVLVVGASRGAMAAVHLEAM